MFQTAWSRPVVARLPLKTVLIRSVAQATEFLANDWPFSPSETYKRAQDVCQNCFDGEATSEEARAALVAACRDAGVLVSM